nr:10072_t:CDS:2 [Entrophospora candida]
MSTHPRQRSQSTSHYSTHTGFHSRKQLILTSISNSLVSGGNSSSGADAKLDKSPKGSIDEPMLPLINLLNKHNDYVTTSSCSGRIAVYCGGKWLFVSHIKIEFPSKNINNNVDNRKELNEFSLNTVFGKECENVILFNSNNVEEYNSLLMENQTSDNRLIYFKFEPMILHIEARTLDSAKNLVTLAINAGYRESGLLTTSKRHMVIIKSSLKLDVPIANFNSITKKISTFVDSSYLYLLILLVRQIGLRKCGGTISDGNDGDVSTVDDESQGLDNS